MLSKGRNIEIDLILGSWIHVTDIFKLLYFYCLYVTVMQNLSYDRTVLLGEMEKEFEKQNDHYFKNLLHHSDTVIRTRAVCIIASISGESSVRELAGILEHDNDALVRHEAAFSLGQLGFTSAIEPLSKAVQTDSNPFVRHEAAIALGVIGSETSRSVLEKALYDDSKEVRDSGNVALSNIEYVKTIGKSNNFTKMTGG